MADTYVTFFFCGMRHVIAMRLPPCCFVGKPTRFRSKCINCKKEKFESLAPRGIEIMGRVGRSESY